MSNINRFRGIAGDPDRAVAAPDSRKRDLLDGVAFGGGSVYQFFVLGTVLVVGVVEFATSGVMGR